MVWTIQVVHHDERRDAAGCHTCLEALQSRMLTSSNADPAFTKNGKMLVVDLVLGSKALCYVVVSGNRYFLSFLVFCQKKDLQTTKNKKNERGNQNNKMIAISHNTMQRKRIGLPEKTVTIHTCHGPYFQRSPLVGSRKSTFNHKTKTSTLHFTSPHPWQGISCSVLDPSLIGLAGSLVHAKSIQWTVVYQISE